jgi:hypothetical protein
MYWVKNDVGNFEVLDGQQRTISVGQYVNGDFSIDFGGRTAMFHNLTKEEQNQILNYELMIYFCEGTDKERLDWFRIINIAGEKLTDQELRNAVYTGPWLSDAKLKFSKSNCVAYLMANDGGHRVKPGRILFEVDGIPVAIAKEALSNSIRHTKAAKRMVWLRRQRRTICLEIADNGGGFSLAGRRSLGMGLKNMRARARKLRGRIAITSELNKGTTVTLSIPSP